MSIHDVKEAKQLTVEQLIAALKSHKKNATVLFGTDEEFSDRKVSASFDSYRGYYHDLAIEPDGPGCSVRELIDGLEGMVGQTTTGYKGGEYLVGYDTLVWVASYGNTGYQVVGVDKRKDGHVYLKVNLKSSW